MSDEEEQTNEKRPRGRPAFVPTDEQRKQVEQYVAVGTTQAVIAEVMGFSIDTLQRHFRKEIDTAGEKASARVAGRLYAKAMEGDVTSMIFWLKTRAGWREKPPVGDKDNPYVVQNGDDASEIVQMMRQNKLKADKD